MSDVKKVKLPRDGTFCLAARLNVSIDQLLENSLARRKCQKRAAKVVEVLGFRVDPMKVLAILMDAFLDLFQISRLLLEIIDSIQQFSQELWVPCVQEKQAFF